MPVIIGLANQMRLAAMLAQHVGTHGLQEGLDNGPLAVGWLASILSQADHRTSAVREWRTTSPPRWDACWASRFARWTSVTTRWGGVLRRLSDDEAWEGIEEELWAATVAVSALELRGRRLDRTTSDGYHDVTDEGVRPCGPSKDHRPDLPHLNLMAAAAQPSGHVIACDGKPGPCADDPRYTPRIERLVKCLARPGRGA